MMEFQKVLGREIKANFDGGNISSDGGSLLLSNLDKKLGFTDALGKTMNQFDRRDQTKVTHSYSSMFRQRVYGLGLGHEDLNDHDELNKDLLYQTAVGKDKALASSATLSRFENIANRQMCVDLHKDLVEFFVDNKTKPPKELILDFDATDDKIHGNQEGRFYHGYYRNYCYLPLYVFCGQELLISYLRPSNIDGALHTWAILALLVKRFRRQWPDVKIIFRGDGGFCREKMLRWCERNNVDYIIGYTKNTRLTAVSSRLLIKAKKEFNRTGKSSKLFCEVYYAARKWNKRRRVICKAEYNPCGPNQRYVITNMKGKPKQLYQKLYCARGDMENRIKEQQLGLFADRTSCQKFWANQLRNLLSACAYVLLERLRELILKGTKLYQYQAGTIREKLLKVGVVIRRNTRTIHVGLSSCFPRKEEFRAIASKINALQ